MATIRRSGSGWQVLIRRKNYVGPRSKTFLSRDLAQSWADAVEEITKKGFQRFKINGKIYKSDDLPQLDKKFKHNIDIVVDRIEINKDIKNQLTDSVETALNISNGIIYIENLNSKKIDIFSTKFVSNNSSLLELSLVRLKDKKIIGNDKTFYDAT